MNPSRLRYARDPEFRLKSVNRKRVRRGQEPLTRAEDIGRDFIAVRQNAPRDEKGRFIA